jgi:hypothetical protein
LIRPVSIQKLRTAIMEGVASAAKELKAKALTRTISQGFFGTRYEVGPDYLTFRSNSTPRRNSPMVTAARKSGMSSRAAAAQKLCTPASARRPLHASLITLVSIKYISGRRWLVLVLQIRVHVYIRHGRQVAPRWAQQLSCQNHPQLGFLAAAMSPGPLI